MPVFVVTAEQARARDAAAIEAGIDSRLLMRRAGERAAHCIGSRLPAAHEGGVVIYCGPGNNGGDGWIVASECASKGIPVSVRAPAQPKTADAVWARSQWKGASVDLPAPAVVVDALLGSGASGSPHGAIADAVAEINALRERGASVVALDGPTGLDATSGAAEGSVVADLTVSFGTAKRGHLMRRDLCGEVVVCDIGLGPHAALGDGAPVLIDPPWVRDRLPRILAGAHKGTRRRLLFVGASPGIAGATILAARAALRSGAGMIRCCAHEASLTALQSAVPEATVVTWPALDARMDPDLLQWPHALLIGPGLGLRDARVRVGQWLEEWKGPVVLDADALSAFADDAGALGALLAGRQAVLTPHAVEAARLLGKPTEQIVAAPFEMARELCRRSGVTVLLKGVPTVIAAPDGTALVSARGTPALATGGSGDVLSGIVTTLLAQTGDAASAAAIGAFVHGRAAEIAAEGRPVRGVTLGDVVDALGESWRLSDDPLGDGELAHLPRVGDA
jgi:NAD(P)H-hydrate epimerase